MAEWILKEKAKMDDVPVSTFATFVSQYCKVKVATVRRALDRLRLNPLGTHGNSVLSEEDIIAAAGMVRSFGRAGHGMPSNELASLLSTVSGKQVSESTADRVRKSNPQLFRATKVKKTSKARIDRRKFILTTESYIEAVEEAWERNNYPAHAIVATDGFVFSMGKGEMDMRGKGAGICLIMLTFHWFYMF